MSSVPIAFRRRPEAVERGQSAARPLPGGPPPPISLMAKPTGAVCNLDCQYCFYLSKEALYPGDRFRMGDDVMERYIQQAVGSQQGREVTIAWQGGEPTLMGLGFFRRAVQVAEASCRPGQQVSHVLQTNGTLLNDEWAAFLKEHRFLVGISVDGPPALHDAYRVDKRGRASSERVLRGLHALQEHGVEHNFLCTVHAANAPYPLEVYRYLRDGCGARYVQFIPIVEHAPTDGDPEATSERTVSAEQWGQFLMSVFDEWLAHDVGTVFVQTFEAALANTLGRPPGVCIFAETCGRALAVEHNGDVYACDHYVDPEHLLGNLMVSDVIELAEAESQRAFGEHKRQGLPRCCTQCDVLSLCRGECPKNRFTAAPDGEPGLNYLCDGYKSFFHHVRGPLGLMAELVELGRPAAMVRESFARAGRNSPCPCGSGRKAKYCHAKGTL